MGFEPWTYLLVLTVFQLNRHHATLFYVICVPKEHKWKYYPIFSVYVDATDACNTLAFQLGSVGVGTSIPSRSWNLKVSIQSVLVKSYFS